MDKEKLANAITKAIGYAENGGAPTEPKAGKTGEMKSIFQYTPDTWKLYAKQILGDENTPLTSDAETYVTHKKVSKWIEAGYSPEQIASMWNAGEQRPDAYKQNWKGVNKKYGVAYDTPAYAKKVSDYTNQFMSEDQGSQPTPQEDPNAKKADILSKMQALVTNVKNRAGSMGGMQPQATPAMGSQGPGTQNNGLLGSIAPQV